VRDESRVLPATRVGELADGCQQVIGFDLRKGLADARQSSGLADVSRVSRVDRLDFRIADFRARAFQG